MRAVDLILEIDDALHAGAPLGPILDHIDPGQLESGEILSVLAASYPRRECEARSRWVDAARVALTARLGQPRADRLLRGRS